MKKTIPYKLILKVAIIISFIFLWHICFLALCIIADIATYKAYLFSLLMNIGIPLAVFKLPKYMSFLALPVLIFSTYIFIALSDGAIGWFELWGLTTNFGAISFLVYNYKHAANKPHVNFRNL